MRRAFLLSLLLIACSAHALRPRSTSAIIVNDVRLELLEAAWFKTGRARFRFSAWNSSTGTRTFEAGWVQLRGASGRIYRSSAERPVNQSSYAMPSIMEPDWHDWFVFIFDDVPAEEIRSAALLINGQQVVEFAGMD